MNKILRTLLKSPARGSEAENGFARNRFLTCLILLMALFGFQQNLLAQTTTITTAGTGFDAANGLSGNSFITFVIENTNTYDVILTGVDNFWKTGNNGTVPSLWYTSSSLSGPFASPNPGIAAPTWTNIITGTALTVTTNGFMPSFTNLSFVIPAGAQYRFALQSTVGISYSGSGAGTPNPNTFTTAGVSLKVHDAKIATLDVGYSGAFPTSANGPRSFTGRIHFQPALPCVAPPTGGQAASTVTTVCPNTSFNLSLIGASGGQGMTYQWQSSANGTTGWTNISGLNNANVTTSQTTTTWYRAVLTCSGQTANSLPVQVTTNATPVSGTFTINKNGMPSATNFTSFAAAIASIECGGAGGPIVFNVVAGSGPYNEQVVVPVIPGTNTTNTVTFNGNGNTISANPTGTNVGVITLNGADFIKFDNFTLTLDAAATAGWGVQLMNTADNNTISNNTINLPHTSTSSNVNGIAWGLNSSFAAGNHGSGNKIQNNTINGGYYGIRINGNTGATDAVNNEITGNNITDVYIYSLYLSNTDGTLIQGNNFSRPTRANVSSFYGTYLTGVNKNTIINKNRFHNAFGGVTASTGAAYVIYFSSTDAPVGSENIVKNNLIYNINTTGTIYAIYNIGSDGSYFFHNTLDLENTGNTGTVYGFYHTTLATNMKFQNNIITIKGGVSGSKYAIYYGVTTSTITSNNNVLYATNGANVGYYTAARATLADWQTASSQDANSISADPVYANLTTGNLKPTNSTINGIGTALTPPVTDDITNATRSTTAPDPGAYEFVPAANDASIIALVAPTSPLTPAANVPVQVTIKNNGTANLTSATITWTVNGVAQPNYSWTGNLANNQTATATIGTFSFTTGNYTINACTSLPNGATDGNPGNDCFTGQVIACNALTGNFTINSTLPASATNFISLTEAANRLKSCGVGGPVTFTVAAGTGPYNEQLILSNISGVSATNTVTFEGSGNTISASPAGSHNGVVTLDGSDYVKINNFVITLDASATTGWGVQLKNTANHNTISNNTINLPLTSTSTLINGIISGTATTTAGNNANYTMIQNNVINGGYYGIQLNGPATTGALKNQIIGNQLKDCYIYNIYLNNSDSTIVSGNDISRPTRTSLTTFYGLYATGANKKMEVSKNRFHNAFDSNTSSTSAAYVIYLSSTDAPLGAENVIKNNLIYNINTNGLIYALYNADSDGAHYIHNTVVLDHATSTGTVRGIYQTTAASNIKVVNNIFTLNGVSGAKHALYFGTTTSAITSNNNVFHVQFGSVGYYSTDFPTLANWKTANSNAYDQNSVAADPVFVSPATGNFRPSSVGVGNIGQPGTGVTDDITGAPRNITTPDPGAYEFGVMPNDVGIVAISGPVSGCGLTAQETITVTIKNYGSNPQTTIPVTYSVNNGTPVTQTYSGTLAPNATDVLTFTQTANLATSGAYTIIAATQLAGDADPANNADTLMVTNSLMPAGPVNIDFEMPATGVNAMRVVTNTRSNITESTAAANRTGSTKGMIMDGVDNVAWIVPSGASAPWTINPEHFSAVYMCFTPQAGQPNDTLFLSFDLKQLYKTTHLNTNFRVTVNGTQIGATYNPPFGGYGTAGAPWTTVKLNISSYLNSPTIEIGLESSVKEEYANGNGTANLIDNILVQRVAGPTTGTGIKENYLQNSVVVFPNPSNGLFNLKVPATTRSYSVEITDLTGKVVKKQLVKNNSGTEQLNLNSTAKGIYILKIASEGNVATRKLIVE